MADSVFHMHLLTVRISPDSTSIQVFPSPELPFPNYLDVQQNFIHVQWHRLDKPDLSLILDHRELHIIKAGISAEKSKKYSSKFANASRSTKRDLFPVVSGIFFTFR